jgi:xylan 1,4-beta-xylosidase
MKNIFFNAHHAPIGAFSSFTLGFRGASGGLGLELGAPANQNVYIGLEQKEGGYYEVLPFFKGMEDESKRYDVENTSSESKRNEMVEFQNIEREFKLCSDRFKAGDLTFTIYSQVAPVPNPEKASEEEMH